MKFQSKLRPNTIKIEWDNQLYWKVHWYYLNFMKSNDILFAEELDSDPLSVIFSFILDNEWMIRML